MPAAWPSYFFFLCASRGAPYFVLAPSPPPILWGRVGAGRLVLIFLLSLSYLVTFFIKFFILHGQSGVKTASFAHTDRGDLEVDKWFIARAILIRVGQGAVERDGLLSLKRGYLIVSAKEREIIKRGPMAGDEDISGGGG